MSSKGSNLSIVKTENSQLIREILYDNSPISRTEIAQRIALSLPTVTTNIAKLISEGAVTELSPAQDNESRSLGRRPVMLDYVPEYGYYVGIELSPYWTYVVITDLRGNLRFGKRNDLISEHYDQMLASLQEFILQGIEESRLSKEKIRGVGVCLPGFVDAETGIIHNNMRREWNGHKLASDLEARICLPVRIENNVRARAISYDLFHKNHSDSPLLYYFISHGLGCSLVIDRQVLSGSAAGAGEIGHMIVDPSGPVCNTCGNRGCLEAVASEGSIVRQCRKIVSAGIPTLLHAVCPEPEKLNITDVLKAQACNDTLVMGIVNDAIRHIGINISSLSNFISPQTIVIDSNLFTNPDNQALVLEIIQSNTFSSQHKHTSIKFLPHDSFSGAVGAAATAVKSFFLEACSE